MKTKIFLIIALMFLTCSLSAQKDKASAALTTAIYEEEVTGNLDKAIELFLEIVKNYPNDRPVAAKALYHLGLVNEKLGNQKATDYFSRLVKSYPDQTDMVSMAKAKLALIESPEKSKTMTAHRLENPPADVPTVAAISPDGRYLTYCDYLRTGDLCLRDLSTGKDRMLTDEGTEDDENVKISQSADKSMWLADSRQIVYVWNITDSSGQHLELRIVAIEGGKPRIISHDLGVNGIINMDCSSDGKHYVVYALGKNRLPQIVLISAMDGTVRTIASFKRYIYPVMIRFLSDSRHIIFDRLTDEMNPERDIFIMSIDTGQESALIQHPADDYLLGLSADGKWLIFASDRTGALGLWAICVSGTNIQGEPKLVKSGIERIVPISVTRGNALYYGIVRVAEDVFVVDLDTVTGKVNSTPRKAIESFEGGNFSPAYSPDGKYLAYISRRGNSPYPTNVGNALCVGSLATGEERVFFREIWRLGIAYIGRPIWSYDSKSIFFGGPATLGSSLSGRFCISLQSGEITPIDLHKNEDRIVGAVFGPDGKYYYSKIDATNKISNILAHDLNSGEVKELYRYPVFERVSIWTALSPDGQWLSFVNSGWGGIRSLNIIPTSGGDLKEIWNFGETNPGTPLINHIWSPDGRYILFSAYEPSEDNWQLWRVPTDGSKPEKMGLQRSWGISDLSINSIRQQVAFASRSGASSDSELWVLENFLPE